MRCLGSSPILRNATGVLQLARHVKLLLLSKLRIRQTTVPQRIDHALNITMRVVAGNVKQLGQARQQTPSWLRGTFCCVKAVRSLDIYKRRQVT